MEIEAHIDDAEWPTNADLQGPVCCPDVEWYMPREEFIANVVKGIRNIGLDRADQIRLYNTLGLLVCKGGYAGTGNKIIDLDQLEEQCELDAGDTNGNG